MSAVVANEAELTAELIYQQESEARHTIRIVKALIDNRLSIHEVDFDSLAAKVSSINSLLDGDEANEGYQTFAALVARMDTMEIVGADNAQKVANLQTALTSQIASMTSRVDGVVADSEAARAQLAATMQTLRDEYEAHVAAKAQSDSDQNSTLDDHNARIEALESVKVLHADRLALLETDNVANKSQIAQLLTKTEANRVAIETETSRATAAEAVLRGDIAELAGKTAVLEGKAETFVTYQEASDAEAASTNANVVAMWAEAGLPIPAGLQMPNGTVSA